MLAAAGDAQQHSWASAGVIAAVVVVLVSALLHFLHTWRRSRGASAAEPTKTKTNAPKEGAEPKGGDTGNKKSMRTLMEEARKASKRHHVIPQHPLLKRCLKGHQGVVRSAVFSPDGSLIASCSEDKSVRLWTVPSLDSSSVPYFQVPLKFDFATACAFACDSRVFVTASHESKALTLYNVKYESQVETGKKKMHVEQLGESHPTKHKNGVGHVLVPPSKGPLFIVTCGVGDDTQLQVFSAKGELLDRADPRQLENYGVAISPDGRLVAVATRMCEAKVFEIACEKIRQSGEVEVRGHFQSWKQVMGVKGHLRPIKCVAFSLDSALLATGSTDGEVRISNINVRYKDGEDPKLLHRSVCTLGSVDHIAFCSPPSADLSKTLLAVGSGSTLQFITAAGEVVDTIADAHEGHITGLHFSPGNKLLLSTGLDTLVNVWNIPAQ